MRSRPLSRKTIALLTAMQAKEDVTDLLKQKGCESQTTPAC